MLVRRRTGGSVPWMLPLTSPGASSVGVLCSVPQYSDGSRRNAHQPLQPRNPVPRVPPAANDDHRPQGGLEGAWSGRGSMGRPSNLSQTRPYLTERGLWAQGLHVSVATTTVSNTAPSTS